MNLGKGSPSPESIAAAPTTSGKDEGATQLDGGMMYVVRNNSI